MVVRLKKRADKIISLENFRANSCLGNRAASVFISFFAKFFLLLKVMDAVGANQMTVMHDTNSGEMLGDNFSQITSYLGISFEMR